MATHGGEQYSASVLHLILRQPFGGIHNWMQPRRAEREIVLDLLETATVAVVADNVPRRHLHLRPIAMQYDLHKL